MIFLVGASAIYLTALQASINAPRSAFQACLKASVDKASAAKVDGDAYEAFVRNACGGQLNSFKTAVVGFDVGNKMSRKDAGADADSMIADFLSGSTDHYRYVLKSEPITNAAAPAKPVTAPAAAPAPTPAAAPAPPK
ncbi:hypothetical protein [Sphingomonas sp.]|uniref:hypothetical protein n=1 Tax=Sphingomonas sp. TaxID=28214 RepID=UPI0025F21781|nr:hypothetical protein [Sphingomonas sp.]MBV9527405.1 hypothetical protein [Sphingomonas sp.]